MNRIISSLSALLVLLSVPTLAEAQKANHLAGSASPYLLQHLDNPVDWYPWAPEALEKAKAENKVILVSVGYASCHWCHVMEEESFMNEEIAALLNRDFISIKIDRESRPNLDEQFMTVTQLITGGGGWPNTVFLTPDGEAFYATTYLPPDQLTEMLSLVTRTWSEEPHVVAQEAKKVTTAVSGYLTKKAEAQDLTPDVIASVAAGFFDGLDPFNGGYGEAPKFPRETMFLFLLDHAERTGDTQALAAVTDMLDGMIRGGIHDHVGGGFHRYAIDPEWHIPHFEKMLYTQAMTGQLLVRTYAVTGKQAYRHAAERLFDYVLRDLRDTSGGFYSAQDADSQDATGDKTEGSYYTWTPEQLAPLGNEATFAKDIFQITEDGELDGSNVLHLAGPVSELAANRGVDEGELQTRFNNLLAKLQEMRLARPTPALDRKIVVSWNSMMIQALAEAGYRLGRPEYSHAAEDAAEFIKSNLTGSDGLNRISFDGKADIAGQLEDYGALGLAFVALHDFSKNTNDKTRWLKDAAALAAEIQTKFGAAEDGFFMAQSVDGLTRILPVNDSDVPSGNALALSLFSKLANRSAAPELEQQAYLLASAVSGHAISFPTQRGFLIKALQDLDQGETGTLRHVGGGKVRVELKSAPSSSDILLSISVADGWHINAHKPLEDYFIATELSADGIAPSNVQYPAPIVKALSFNAQKLALLEGDFDITAEFDTQKAPKTPQQISLNLQACSDEICLAPETLSFWIW
ncbi:DUF255 domain-containing protein [Roseibium sp.]|uniref:DUF255 domain-containing protein n=1 Tax=Roseibium sp. TaxID=1936156 RepID=UPI003B51B154